MKTVCRIIALAVVGFGLAPLVHAQTTIGTISCTSTSGATLSPTVYAFDVDTDYTDGFRVNFAFFDTDPSQLAPLLAAQNAQTSFTCNYPNNQVSLSLNGAIISEVGADAFGAYTEGPTYPVAYVTAMLTFTTLTGGGVTTVGLPPSTAKIPTEVKEKAFANFKAQVAARLAKPSAATAITAPIK